MEIIKQVKILRPVAVQHLSNVTQGFSLLKKATLSGANAVLKYTRHIVKTIFENPFWFWFHIT